MSDIHVRRAATAQQVMHTRSWCAPHDLQWKTSGAGGNGCNRAKAGGHAGRHIVAARPLQSPALLSCTGRLNSDDSCADMIESSANGHSNCMLPCTSMQLPHKLTWYCVFTAHVPTLYSLFLACASAKTTLKVVGKGTSRSRAQAAGGKHTPSCKPIAGHHTCPAAPPSTGSRPTSSQTGPAHAWPQNAMCCLGHTMSWCR